MIYFDNAATTMRKPDEVVEAVCAAMTSFGGPGRGSHKAALDASMAVFDARRSIAELLDAPSAKNVSFAMNATMALNIAIEGVLHDGEAALTTAASHNSVLRPLARARDERGCEMRVAPILPDGSLDWQRFEQLLDGASVVAVTHASNVTGDVYDVARMCEMAHEQGSIFILDAAQTAGAWPVSFKQLRADIVCFTGHKGLYGPQGTGGLIVADGIEVRPLLEGGSGVHSYDERHPRFMPEALEAGTANAHGLCGLAAGAKYISRLGVDAVQEKVATLAYTLAEGARRIPGIRVYGCAQNERCGIVALNVGDLDSGAVSDALFSDYGICTRPGAHCAPLMHKALGTQNQGVVRFSLGLTNTPDEVEFALKALEEISEGASKLA